MWNPFSTLLRIYHYSDADKGYGDAGTVRYVRVSKDEFELTTRKNQWDDSTYEIWNPTEGLRNRLSALGWNYYSMGYDFATQEEYNAELLRVRELLERLENVE